MKSTMAKRVEVLAAVVALGLCLALPAATAVGGEEEFVSPPPQEVIKTDGGSVRLFSRDLRALKGRRTNITAALITVEPHSLALPLYSSANELSYVFEGCAYVGLITPLGIPTGLRYVQEGDLLALPRGWVSWIWNDGEKPLRAFDVSDVSRGPEPGEYSAFELVGHQQAEGEEGNGILNGFSHELLARAWDVDAEDVKKLLEGQQGAAFVKLGKKKMADLAESLKVVSASGSGKNVFPDFKFSTAYREPDIDIENGGKQWSADGLKLRVLKHFGLSATRFRLEAGAMLAPHWHADAAVVLHVLSGKGRMEIVGPGGENAMRKQDLKEGDVVGVPAQYPSAVIADESGPMEWIGVVTSSYPTPAFLAGRNSVFKGIPRAILTAAFNVDDELEDKFYSRRRGDDDLVFFPPRKAVAMF